MNKHQIFLVDDHPLVREWLATLIQRQKDLVVCGEADDAPAALDGVGQTKPEIVIVDLALKNSSGLDLIKDLVAWFPDMAVIVLSMHEEHFYAERALRAGARGYVTKRESTRTIIEAVRRVLDGHIYLNESIATQLAGKYVAGRVAPGQSPVQLLSDRELGIFEMMGRGLATRQIAEALHISTKTVQTHQARIKEKIGLTSINALLREAFHWVEQHAAAPSDKASSV